MHMDVHRHTIFYVGRCPLPPIESYDEFSRKKRGQGPEWPGNSLDLNPIEYMRTQMKDEATEKQPSSATNLIRAIKKA